MPCPNNETETTSDTPREFVRFGGGYPKFGVRCLNRRQRRLEGKDF